MPNIKPLHKLVTKARTIREHHRARHTPSGFAFALADSIDYLDQGHWAASAQNLIVRGLLHTIDDHEEPPERNPFK